MIRSLHYDIDELALKRYINDWAFPDEAFGLGSYLLWCGIYLMILFILVSFNQRMIRSLYYDIDELALKRYINDWAFPDEADWQQLRRHEGCERWQQARTDGRQTMGDLHFWRKNTNIAFMKRALEKGFTNKHERWQQARTDERQTIGDLHFWRQKKTKFAFKKTAKKTSQELRKLPYTSNVEADWQQLRRQEGWQQARTDDAWFAFWREKY